MSITKNNTRMLEGDIDLTTQITGVLPVANGGTGSSTGSSAAVFSESFESSEQTITAGSITINHNLGGIPKLFQVVLRCVSYSNTHGYSVGDEVDITHGSLSGAYLSCFTNSAQVGLVIGGSGGFHLPYKDASDYNSITASQWRLVFRAFA